MHSISVLKIKPVSRILLTVYYLYEINENHNTIYLAFFDFLMKALELEDSSSSAFIRKKSINKRCKKLFFISRFAVLGLKKITNFHQSYFSYFYFFSDNNIPN